jgi:hypothetical protein
MLSGLLLLIGVAAAIYRGSIIHEESRQLVIVVEPGTAEQIEAGLLDNSDYHRIEMILGVRDVLVIENQDEVWHQVGPYWVAPGHTLVQRFYRPGTIRASCSITASQEVEIVIHERR